MSVRRREDAPYELGGGGVLPVVVHGDESAARVADLQHGIRQWINNCRWRKRGPKGSHYHCRADRSDPANNKPGDNNMITTFNKTPGANIQKLMGCWLDGHELRSVKVALKKGGSYSTGGEPVGGTTILVCLNEIA